MRKGHAYTRLYNTDRRLITCFEASRLINLQPYVLNSALHFPTVTQTHEAVVMKKIRQYFLSRTLDGTLFIAEL